MEYSIFPLTQDEAPFLFTDATKDQERGCIGHLRGDFGRDGREFWTSWWEHLSELKTQEFRNEFDEFVITLRKDSMLRDRNSMAEFCARYPEARIPGAWHSDVFGFQVNTNRHRYYIRCFPHAGDYNFYIYCYLQADRQQEKADSGQMPTAQKKKHNPPVR